MSGGVVRFELCGFLQLTLGSVQLPRSQIGDAELEAAKSVVRSQRYRLFEKSQRLRRAALLHQHVSKIHIRLLARMRTLFLPGDRVAKGFNCGLGLRG